MLALVVSSSDATRMSAKLASSPLADSSARALAVLSAFTALSRSEATFSRSSLYWASRRLVPSSFSISACLRADSSALACSADHVRLALSTLSLMSLSRSACDICTVLASAVSAVPVPF